MSASWGGEADIPDTASPMSANDPKRTLGRYPMLIGPISRGVPLFERSTLKLCGYGSGFFWARYPHSARISRNRSAASRRDILRRDRSNRTSTHANAATLSLISTADSIRPVAACLTST